MVPIKSLDLCQVPNVWNQAKNTVVSMLSLFLQMVVIQPILIIFTYNFPNMPILRCAFIPSCQHMKILKNIYFMTSSLMNSIAPAAPNNVLP